MSDIETLFANASANGYGVNEQLRERARQEIRRLLKEAELTARAGAMLEQIVVDKTVEVANLKGQVEQLRSAPAPEPQALYCDASHTSHGETLACVMAFGHPSSNRHVWVSSGDDAVVVFYDDGPRITYGPLLGPLRHATPDCSNYRNGEEVVGLKVNVTCPVCKP